MSLTGTPKQDARWRALRLLRQKRREIDAEIVCLELELTSDGFSISSIQSIPSEILSIIFKCYLLEKPRLIRRILLVCRHWHDIATHDPTLWTRIEIKVERNEKDLKKMAISMKSYIDACVKHSGTMLLDIEVDCRRLQSQREHIDSAMMATLVHLFPDANINMMGDWVYSQDWYQFVAFTELDTPGHPSHLVELLGKLTDGKVIRRCRNLTLILPEDKELVEKVLSALSGKVPSLHMLTVSGYLLEEPGRGEHAIFKAARSLEYLKISDLQTLELIKPAPLQLRWLEVTQGLNEKALTWINKLTNLHTLKIAPEWSYSPSTSRPSGSLRLPKLEALHFIGPNPLVYQATFELATLQHLYLTDQPLKFFKTLPDLCTLHVHWSVSVPPVEDRNASVKQAATNVLLHYPISERMSVPADYKAVVLGVIKELKREGKFVAALVSVTFENTHGYFDEHILNDSV